MVRWLMFEYAPTTLLQHCLCACESGLSVSEFFHTFLTCVIPPDFPVLLESGELEAGCAIILNT